MRFKGGYVSGVPDQGGELHGVPWKNVFLSENAPDLKSLRLRNPENFIAGGIHGNSEAWEVILREHPFAEMVLDWIGNKIDIAQFSQHFKGAFLGSRWLVLILSVAFQRHVSWGIHKNSY